MPESELLQITGVKPAFCGISGCKSGAFHHFQNTQTSAEYSVGYGTEISGYSNRFIFAAGSHPYVSSFTRIF